MYSGSFIVKITGLLYHLYILYLLVTPDFHLFNRKGV